MITFYSENVYEDRKIINFVLDEKHYTNELFYDGYSLFWCYDFNNSEAYLIDNIYEIEQKLKLYYREQKLKRIIMIDKSTKEEGNKHEKYHEKCYDNYDKYSYDYNTLTYNKSIELDNVVSENDEYDELGRS